MIDHDRITDRVNLQTIRLELRRAVGPLAVFIIGVIVAGASITYIFNNINGGIGSTHTVRFAIADATGVVPGRAEVRFYGIQAGTVQDASVSHGRAVLTVSVADKYGPVYRNARAELRPNTALQDMYLDIVTRGTPSAGIAEPNYIIPVNQTHSPTNLADVLNVFQPDVRAQMYNLIDQLGGGLQDRGQDLRLAFIQLMPFLEVVGGVSQQLAIRRQLTQGVVHDTAILAHALASRSTQLHDLITSGTSTLAALATQGGAPLRESIARLPGALQSAESLLSAYDALQPRLDPTIASLRPVADALPAGLHNLSALASSADPALVKLRTPLHRLVPLATALAPFYGHLAGALRQIQPQIPDLGIATTDLANCTTQLDEFFNWDASMSKFYDDKGPFTRGNFKYGFYTATTVKDTNFVHGAQCDAGQPIGAVPSPKYPGPPPAP